MTIELAERAATTSATVLITGESGTGKDVIARFIHSRSLRSGRPFIAFNAGALPDGLVDAELFGHRRGAFTGAVRDSPGRFVAAQGGTLFIDEIAEASPALQVRLLRALQERVVVPVGAVDALPVDVRVIVATHRDLEAEVRRGAFRHDLYYRIDVIGIHVPPLRERPEDIPLLAAVLLERISRRSGGDPPLLDPDALELLLSYPWPGNVRELENAMERAAAMASGGIIRVADLPPRLAQGELGPVVPEPEVSVRTLADVESEHLLQVLAAEGGNRTRAARTLGIDVSTLRRRLRRLGPTGS